MNQEFYAKSVSYLEKKGIIFSSERTDNDCYKIIVNDNDHVIEILDGCIIHNKVKIDFKTENIASINKKIGELIANKPKKEKVEKPKVEKDNKKNDSQSNIQKEINNIILNNIDGFKQISSVLA